MKVTISQTAYDQIHALIEYLEERWSEKIRDRFLVKLDKSMRTMEIMPYGFPESQRMEGLRKCVITPQTSAFYRVDEDEKEIEIIAIIDNRMNF